MNANSPAARFEADPSDLGAFESLEEAHYLAADWGALVRVYERRLEAPDLANLPAARASLLMRLGQVLEERCLEVDRAIECYQELARSQPEFRPPLVQLRRIYVARKQWELALQISDVEKALPMAPHERAAFCTEMGEIWRLHLGDPAAARDFYVEAIEADPDHVDAQLGLAAAREASGDRDGARESLEQVIERLAGPDRAPALVALARLVADDDPGRAEELHRRALTDDPRNEEALDALVESVAAKEQWEMVAELQERRFGLAAGAIRRLAIAHDAGRLWLERLRNPQGARLWLRRAVDLFPEDPVAWFLLADTERLAGNSEALLTNLSRGCELAAEGAPSEALRECAQLAKETGELAQAVSPLQRLMARFPERRELASELADLLERLGRDDELMEILERRVGLARGERRAHAAALVELGAAQEERAGDLDGAISSYEQAFGVDPRNDEAAGNLARLYRKSEDWTKLRLHLDAARARATGPRAAELHCDYAELLLERFGDPEAAREAFETTLALAPDFSRAERGLEHVAVQTGDEDALLDSYEREAAVTTERGRLAFLVWELVRIREERAEREEALLWLDRLVGADPENRKALEHLARLHEQLDHDEELVETLERLDPLLAGQAQASNRRRIAGLRRSLGETDRAVDAYGRALEADPNDTDALASLADLYESDGRYAELVEVERQRADALTGSERGAALSRVASLTLEHLEDAQGTIAVLAQLVEEGLSGPAEEAKLEELLEAAERYEELEERLAARRPDAEPRDASAIDRRRAVLLLEHLARPSEAAALLAPLHEAHADDPELRAQLERALRESNDAGALATLLALRVAEADDPDEIARLRYERAVLLERAAGHEDEAQSVYQELAASDGEWAEEASERLEGMLERSGDWSALRGRLEERLSRNPDPIGAHERLAAICRDRLGDRVGAIEHLEYAAEQEPERADLWHSLALLYEEEQRFPDQLRAYEAELATEPEPDRARLLHACAAAVCRDRLEDTEGAERHFAGLFELDPDDRIAAEFLARRYEADGRDEELAALLARRLERIGDVPSRVGESAASLRLRLASLRATSLDDVAGAIAALEPAAEDEATRVLVAEPLADLYQRSERDAEYLALCRRTAGACTDPGERASWSLRLADALREADEPAAAAEAYRQTLNDRPDSREARTALRDLYRRLGESDALARLLESELSRVAGREEVPLRLELAELLVQALSRPGDGLVHLRRVLELDPDETGAGERALSLAEQLGRHEERLAILDVLIARERTRAGRAARLAQRGALLADPLGRREPAAEALRESLALDPTRTPVRRQLRKVLEGLENWQGVLDGLAEEARRLDVGSRVSVYDEAAHIAAAHLGSEAALPWLERLRAARPDDPETLSRIAEVHREGDRPEELVRALEAELALEPEDSRRQALESERAELFEKRLDLPARAAEALEALRRIDPDASGVLERLSRLYAGADRPAALASVLEKRLARVRGRERRSLCEEAARLHRDALGDPSRAAELLWDALGETPADAERTRLLCSLGDCFRQAQRTDLQVRASEAELAALDPGEPVFAERRSTLRRDLARAYEEQLARPGRALAHWRALVEEGGSGESHDEAERALLRGLRAAGEHVELARRLEGVLERDPGNAEDWLELARLRAERLYRPGAAADAYRAVLGLDPGCEEAMQGLRVVSERLGDWSEVARALELEIELPGERPAAHRAALWRRLGEIAWRRLDSSTRASRAFASALEADPSDRVSLRSLQELFEAMEDWRGALDFYESEIEVLGDDEPERRQEIWLRVGEIARDRLDDAERGARAFRAAGELGDLTVERLAEWAELHRRLEQPDHFATVFGRWCDAEGSRASAADHLELAGVLEQLGRMEPALARLERAVELDPKHAGAWDELVRLREQAGDLVGCGDALERAADCRAGDAASERRHRAAGLVEGEDPERALSLLSRAVCDDPARSPAHADLARLAEALGQEGKALAAAERMLDLGPPADERLALAAALAGARAARSLERSGAAERLYAAARHADASSAEAVAGHAEMLFARGEHAAARAALEERLTLETEDPQRALHLAQLADCLAAVGDTDAALEAYREAIALDADLGQAQEGHIALLEREGRASEAIAALRSWARGAGSGPERAERMVRAALHERESTGNGEEAEVLLREATAIDPGSQRAWRLLAEGLQMAGRSGEALEVATRALEALPDSAPGISQLHALRGEALEERGERAEAAAAWREAARLDPSRCEAALAAARLQRGLGEWSDAADGLREFVNQYPGDDPAGLASVLQQLGRLLAGPLENLEGAVEVYRRAMAADPELPSVREALADLLSHRADYAGEALELHHGILAVDPLRQPSLRAVLRIAQARDASDGVAWGRAQLAALGIATQEEREAVPDRPPLPRSGAARFSDPAWEAARILVQESARELGEALGVGNPTGAEESDGEAALAAFRGAVVSAEGRLAAPAIVPLTDPELTEVVVLLADLASEAEEVRGDGRLVNELSRQLGRRARKRLRRVLEEISADEIARIDFAAWREELRGLACLEALSSTGASLRTALCAWLPEDADGETPMPGPGDDITALVAACPESRALLRRLVLDWTQSLQPRSRG